MSIFETYFSRFETFNQRLSEPVNDSTNIIVVIPCYNEPNILQTLESLLACKKPQCSVEIIVAVNYNETSSEEIKTYNNLSLNSIITFSNLNSTPQLKILTIPAFNLPEKYAGVGLARKILMDEATHRFASINNENGIIVSCDADVCVSTNYFIEIEKFYTLNNSYGAANIYFEHPLSGNLPQQQYKAIAQYELYLRYYVQQLKRIHYPFAFHTVGSCFTLTVASYCRQGGMNKRQAGEDFYFLQKLFQTEKVGIINSATVYPSSRISDRVPFGTGTALNKLLEEESIEYSTFTNESFNILQDFFCLLPDLYNIQNIEHKAFYEHLNILVREFIPFDEFFLKIEEIRHNSATEVMFCKRFFNWFNGLKVFRFLNYAHNTQFKKIPITQAAAIFLQTQQSDVFNLLQIFRKLEQ